MNDYYFLYYKPLKLFLRTHEGRFEHTMKQITETCDEYAKNKDKCPNGCIADILIVIKSKDIMFNTKLHEGEEDYDY